MSSYQSSSFASSMGDSDMSSTFSTSPRDESHMPSISSISEEEPSDHPLLSSFNREVVQVDKMGFELKQTKSAWMKQMAAFDKEDARKAKKDARKKKNHHEAEVPTGPKLTGKALKRAKAKEAEEGLGDD